MIEIDWLVLLEGSIWLLERSLSEVPNLIEEVEDLEATQLIMASEALIATFGPETIVGGVVYLPVGILETIVDAAEVASALSTALMR